MRDGGTGHREWQGWMGYWDNPSLERWGGPGTAPGLLFQEKGKVSVSVLGVPGSCNSCGHFHKRPTQIDSVLGLKCSLLNKIK